jgi:DNA polymerase III beta subunit, N-terminal domain
MTAGEVLDSQELLNALGVDTAEPSSTDKPVAAELPATIAEVSNPPKFQISYEALNYGVAQCLLAVPRTDFLISAKNLYLEAFAGKVDSLTITGSSSYVSIASTTHAVSVLRSGRIAVPAAKFAAIVHALPASTVTVTCTDSAVQVEAEGRWTLRAASVQDAPKLPDTGDLRWWEISRTAFERAVAGTRYAAGSDFSQDSYMQLDFSSHRVTASDGKRLAQIALDDLPSNLACCFPTLGVDILCKMLKANGSERFHLADGRQHLVAEIGDNESLDKLIVSHLMQPFPADVRGALVGPLNSNRDELLLHPDELIAALNRAKPTIDDETLAIALKIGVPSEGKVTIASRNKYDDSSQEILLGQFRARDTERTAAARTVTVMRDHLATAVRAVTRAASQPEQVVLLLGQPRSKARPAPVVVHDVGQVAFCVLPQIRSDWIT